MYLTRSQQAASNWRSGGYEYKSNPAIDGGRAPAHDEIQRVGPNSQRANSASNNKKNMLLGYIAHSDEIDNIEAMQDGHPNDMTLRVETSIDSLITIGHLEEWPLVQYIALLGSEFIPEELLLAIMGNDQKKLDKAIAILERISFVIVSYKEEKRGLTMPSMIQDQIINYVANHPNISQDTSKLLEDLLYLLNNLLPAITDGRAESWKAAKIYIPTIESMLQHGANKKALLPENKAAALLNAKLGTAYFESGDTEQGLYYQEHGLAKLLALCDGKDQHAAGLLNRIASSYGRLGDIRKSLDYNERAVEIMQVLYNGDHPDIANTLSNIGTSYQILGYVSKGLVYKEQSLRMWQALYTGNHPNVAGLLNSVGTTYRILGDVRNGLDYSEQALKMRRVLYPDNHADVADSLNSVGTAYQSLGDAKQGFNYKELALKMRLAIHRGDHPDVAASLNNVGTAYQILGEVRKGLDYKEQALKMRQALHPGNHPAVAASLNNVGTAYKALGELMIGLDYQEQALRMLQAIYPGDHPAVAVLLSNLCSSYKRLGDVDKVFEYQERARTMKQAVNLQNQEEEEFRGQGTLSDYTDSRFEYYNSGLDNILRLRLDGIGYNTKTAVLRSQYFGRDVGSAAGKIAYDVKAILSNGNAQIVLAPVNLYNEHWVGLLFRDLGGVVEVTYMDSEQKAIVPQLKVGLEQRFAIHGYKSLFLQARLEKQRYNNCGSELIENFVHYLTFTRATQEGAIYVHSLLVENNLLDPKGYGLKIEENKKLLGFLSNAAPLAIRSMDVSTLSSSYLIKESLGASGGLRIKHEYEDYKGDGYDYGREAAKVITSMLYRTNIWFKTLDFVVDSARLGLEPTLVGIKELALDYAHLYGMVSGVNGYSVVIAGAEAMYQTYLGEYGAALWAAAGTASAMALPILLARVNRPYLGVAYGAYMAVSTAYGAILNAYSFALELGSNDAILKSTMAYKDLAEWLAASPLESFHDFGAKVKEYKLQINDLLFEKERAVVQAQMKGEFEQKIFDYIYLPMLVEKYELLNGVIRGSLTEEEAQGLKAKHVAITSPAQSYEHCMELKDTESTEYYCYNMANYVLDHVKLVSDGSIEIIEQL